MRLALAVALALPLSAFGQLQLLLVSPGGDTPVSGVYDCGSASAGDRLDTRFRVRNTGTGPISVSTLRAQGVGFSIINAASVPLTLAAGSNLDFSVRFIAADFGTYSANLQVNGISLLLRAAVSAGVIIRVDDKTVAAGDTVDFGRTERGAPLRKTFHLDNRTSQPVVVQQVTTSGNGFVLAGLPELPLRLSAGESSSVELEFRPAAAGVFAASLLIDNRSFRLTGAATEPPFERPVVEITTTPSGSASQGVVTVRFPKPSRARGSGLLRLQCLPIAGATPNDPAILFLSSGKREIAFTVEEGDTSARFGNAQEASFQTGTTAGAFTLEASVGGFTEQASLSIAAAPVKIGNSGVLRGSSSVELSLTGYDNTHATSTLSFTFYDRTGKQVQPGAIRVDATADFRRHYSKEAGGSFTLKAIFPVAGSAADIAEAEVEVVNGAGTSRTERLRF